MEKASQKPPHYPYKPEERPLPGKEPEINFPKVPENPSIPIENPDVLPDEPAILPEIPEEIPPENK